MGYYNNYMYIACCCYDNHMCGDCGHISLTTIYIVHAPDNFINNLKEFGTKNVLLLLHVHVYHVIIARNSKGTCITSLSCYGDY